MTKSYFIGTYKDIETVWGLPLWRYLNKPNVIKKMMLASDNNRPAIEPLVLDLIFTFGDPIQGKRIKRFIGFLVRQVMSNNGYKHLTYGNKLKANQLFVTSSKYRRK